MSVISDHLDGWVAAKQAELATAMRAAGDQAVSQLQAAAPVRTGRLKASFDSEVTTGGEPKLVIKAVDYASPVNEKRHFMDAPLSQISANISDNLKR